MRHAQQLLQRYGVVFRDLLQRETALPPWRDILQCLRRLEARGEIRGGRFVHGFVGEQFALPEAVVSLRALRRRPPDVPELVIVADQRHTDDIEPHYAGLDIPVHIVWGTEDAWIPVATRPARYASTSRVPSSALGISISSGIGSG